MNAHDWAHEHPELAAELAQIEPEPADLTAARLAEIAETLVTLFWVSLLMAALLLGRLWWDWGSWSLVAIGAVGCALAGGLYELGRLVFRRVVWVNNVTGEVRR